MTRHGIAIMLCTVCLFSLARIIPAKEVGFEYPFSNRIVFSESPEIGTKWHGGVRMNDLLYWDLYWNAGDWITIDLLVTGVSGTKLKDEENGGTINMTDQLSLLSLKSRPLTLSLLKNPYKIGGGLVFYGTKFEFINNEQGTGFPAQSFSQAGIFITQSWYINNRHYLNLLTSVTSHKLSENNNSISSVYLVPGYRCFFGPNRRWSFDLEYYYMNPIELPMKTLQIAFDANNSDFYNPDQQFVSFMFWGFSYSWKHLKVEMHLGHHILLEGPKIPMIGLGWDF